MNTDEDTPTAGFLNPAGLERTEPGLYDPEGMERAAKGLYVPKSET